MKYIKLAGPFKRIIAAIIDALMIIFSATALFAAAGVPIVNHYFNGNALGDEVVVIQKQSQLFRQTQVGMMSVYTSDDYDMAVYNYYVNSHISSQMYTSDQYYDHFLRRGQTDTLFDWAAGINAETPWEVPHLAQNSAKVQPFYKKLYQEAINDLETTHVRYIEIRKQLETMQGAAQLISLVPFVLIFIVILPLFLKNGATLGKLTMRIGHANMYGYQATRGQQAFRGVTTILIDYVGLFLALPFISAVVMTIRKDRRSLTDLIAMTVTFDNRESVVFNSANDEQQFEAKRELKRLETEAALLKAQQEIEQERIIRQSQED